MERAKFNRYFRVVCNIASPRRDPMRGVVQDGYFDGQNIELIIKTGGYATYPRKERIVRHVERKMRLHIQNIYKTEFFRAFRREYRIIPFVIEELEYEQVIDYAGEKCQ